MNRQLMITPEPFAYSEFEALGPDLDVGGPPTGAGPNSPNNICWVQNTPNRIMDLRLAEDGIRGPAIRSAIRSFQEKQVLPADGSPSSKTEAELWSALAPLSHPPQPQPLYTTPPSVSPLILTATPSELTYTTKDVIDERISVPAQHSLVRLSKNPTTSADAVGMLEEVKAGRLAGIYCVNWEIPAQRALKLGSNWWSVISDGQDAILMRNPDNPTGFPPLIAFRRTLSPDCGLLKGEQRFPAFAARLDAALIQAWKSYLRFRHKKERHNTSVVVVVQNNIGHPVNSPALIVRLRDPQTGALLGEQRAVSSRLTFILDRPRTVLRVETSGDPRFWPWVGVQPHTVQEDQANYFSSGQRAGATAQAIAPRLRDITNSTADLVDAGVQNGNFIPAGAGCGYPPNRVPLPLLPVLSDKPNACHADRLRTDKRLPTQPLRGTMRILAATPASVDSPSLFMVWIPHGLDPNKARRAVDFHVYLMPQIGSDVPETLQYPLGRQRKNNGNGQFEQPYVGKGYSHLMWRTWGTFQHDLAQRACVYVVPVPSRTGGFTGLTGAKLADWLKEIAVFVIRSLDPDISGASPSIGRVAISGFSEGGDFVRHVLITSIKKGGASKEFITQNVKEIYFFDLPIRYARRVSSVTAAWQQLGGDRIVRIYTLYAATYQAFVSLVRTKHSDLKRVRFKGSSVDAMEVNSTKGSAILIPESLLMERCVYQNCKIPVASSTHLWFVQFFMAHALSHSKFAAL